LTCDPLQRFVENILEELHEDFIELVYDSAMKSDLKSFPIDVLKVVSSKNGTSEKLGKNGTMPILAWKICMVWRFGFWDNFNT